MNKAEEMIICDWTASEVVRAYRRSGENFEIVKKKFQITSMQLRRLLKQAGIDAKRSRRMSMMEELGLRYQDFALENQLR